MDSRLTGRARENNGFQTMRVLLITAISCLGAWCSASGIQASEDDALSGAEKAMVLIGQAESARLQASRAGAEWLRTEQLIEEARRLVAAENWEGAEDIARKAMRQSELALDQAAREEKAWRDRVIR